MHHPSLLIECQITEKAHNSKASMEHFLIHCRHHRQVMFSFESCDGYHVLISIGSRTSGYVSALTYQACSTPRNASFSGCRIPQAFFTKSMFEKEYPIDD